MSPEPLSEVDLSPGSSFPVDRVMAIALGDGEFDPQNPARPLEKGNFLMLRRDERLAALQTRFDAASNRFRIDIGERTALDADVSSSEGRGAVERFFAAMFGLTVPPVLARAEPFRFTDVEPQCVSFINLASVRALGERIGQHVDPLRFRANIYFDGWPPFSELKLKPGARLRGGAIEFEVTQLTGRCAATEVNPATAQRDLKVPMLLRKHYGHIDMGFYVVVQSPGTLRTGDAVELVEQ
jgi:uncharacterized protein YcbX